MIKNYNRKTFIVQATDVVMIQPDVVMIQPDIVMIQPDIVMIQPDLVMIQIHSDVAILW
jgi:hypothetical protein